MRKNAVLGCVTLTLSLLFALALGETVVRIFAPQNIPRSFNYSTMDSEFLFRPNQTTR